MQPKFTAKTEAEEFSGSIDFGDGETVEFSATGLSTNFFGAPTDFVLVWPRSGTGDLILIEAPGGCQDSSIARQLVQKAYPDASVVVHDGPPDRERRGFVRQVYRLG